MWGRTSIFSCQAAITGTDTMAEVSIIGALVSMVVADSTVVVIGEEEGIEGRGT